MDLYQQIVEDTPQLQRGRVWCQTCGRTEQVNATVCLRHGWPVCCGHTMSLDSPTERHEEGR